MTKSMESVTLVRVLLVTGSCGAGRSVIAAEINDALAELKVPNAAIDLDALTRQWPPRWLVSFARGGPPASLIIPGELR
jgi:hypothetical protein